MFALNKKAVTDLTPEMLKEAENNDGWELVNNDGFIHRRRKRLAGDGNGDDLGIASRPVDPVTDKDEEEKKRREWKRRTLLKLKAQYQTEISSWEFLSNTLNDMQDKAIQFQEQQQRERQSEGTVSFRQPSGIGDTAENASSGLLDELLLQEEAQEAIIRDISNICDVANAMCSAQEESLKQSYINLPIWESPEELMTSLCDE